jgi:cobaltochelatase CobS
MARKKTQETPAITSSAPAPAYESRYKVAGIPLPWKTDNTPDDQHHVPTIDEGYVFPEEAFDLVRDIMANKCILCTGHASTGKSSLLKQLFARMNVPVADPCANGQMPVSALIGHWVVRGGEMVWADGLLTLAMRRGWAFIFDEIDNASDNTLVALNNVTDRLPAGETTRRNTLLDKGGETIVAHPWFRFTATGNTIGCMESFAGLYRGRRKLDFAFVTRFSVYHIPFMRPENESQVLVDKTKIHPQVAAKMVIVANQLRTAFENGVLRYPVALRQLLDWAELMARHKKRADDEGLMSMPVVEQERRVKAIALNGAKRALLARAPFEDHAEIEKTVLLTFG